MTSRHSQQRTLTLLELFVQSSGSLHARALLQIDEELLPMWHTSMLTYVTLIGMVSGLFNLSCVAVVKDASDSYGNLQWNMGKHGKFSIDGLLTLCSPVKTSVIIAGV